MICLSCNVRNDVDAAFCRNCGSALSKPEPAPDLNSKDYDPFNLASHQSESLSDYKDSLIGYIIDSRYRLESVIGKGGMGAVYRATRLLIGDTVAIKLIRPDQLSDSNTGERFRREAQAAARLKHPNALAIYDFGVSQEGLFYLVMELVEGEDLRSIIKRQGALLPAIASEITAQVCGALEEAHHKGIIHRDIKPDNIIVQMTPGGLRVKVLDFGIAKLKEETPTNLTQTGGVMGTPHYMSPEQCLGEELDGRSDIYSLGIVLYEMLTGSLPFNAPISTAVVVQHVNQRPPSLREKNGNISPEIEAVAMHALEKQRAGRPQSASMFAQELISAVNSLPFQARPSSGAYPSSSDVNRNGRGGNALEQTVMLEALTSAGKTSGKAYKPGLAFTCVALFLVLAGGVVWTIRKYRNQSSPESSVQARAATKEDSDPNALPATFAKKFVGTANNGIGVEMQLQRNGESLSGTYFYFPTNESLQEYGEKRVWPNKENSLIRVDIEVSGTIDEQRNYSLDELDRSGKRTGVFKGRFKSPTELEAVWSRPDGKETISFSLKESGAAAPADSYRIITKQLKKNKKYLTLDLTYPQMEGFSNSSIQEDFNRRMQRPVSETVKSATDTPPEPGMPDIPSEESRGFQIKYRSTRFISILLNFSSYSSGAAHPLYGTSSFNYDLQTGSELKLSNLFKPGSNYLSIISKICANDITRQKRKNGFNEQVSEGDVLNVMRESETFCVTDKGLIIIFGVYQIGSFAEGEYRVLVPYSSLKTAIEPNGILAPFGD